MNDSSPDQQLSFDEVISLRQRLLELEQSHHQGQQQVEQLTQQLAQEKMARQQAEDRLQLTLTSAQMIAWDMDLIAHYVICSSNAQEMWGICEGTGEDFFAAIHPDDRQQVMQAAERAIAGETDYFQEYRVIDPSGEICWLNSQGRVYLDETGRGVRVIGLSVDVTERKQTEMALRESEEQLRVANQRFQLAARAVNCMIYDWHVAEDWVERTDGLTRILGYSPEEVEPTGNWWRDRIHPDDLQAILDRASVALIKSDYFTSEYRVLNRSNQYVDVLDQCLVVARDRDGNPTRIVGSTTDISDRKRVEADLLQREQEFRTVVENTPDIIVRYDREFRHLYVNPSIERALGLLPEHFIGKTGVEMGFTDRTSQDWVTVLHQVFETGQSHSFEFKFPNPEGELRLYQARLMPELIEGEQITTVLAIATDVTQYKQTETSLRQSEERVRLAMAAAQMGTWDVDLITGKAIWSEHHFTMLGYDPVATGEASEAMWSSRLHPDDVEQVIQAWQQARQAHSLYQAEYRVIRADNGQIAWLAGLGSFTYDPTGQAVRSIGVVFDITERKRAEAALAESNQTLQAVIQACPLAIMGLRADGTVQLWNPAAERIFGWSQQEVLGQFLPAIPEAKRDEFVNKLALALQGQGLVGVETQRQRKGNVLFDVELWTAPVDATQAGMSCLSVVADISDRKQAEAALQESKERFQALADNIAQLAWMADEQGSLFWYNQRWFDYTGTTLEEMQGWGWQKVHHPDHLERVVEKFRRHIESGEIWEDTFPLRGQDGSYRWFLSRAVPIRDEQGRVLRWFGTNTDITDRQQAEAEREQLLQREQAAREQAEAANRVKDEFLAVLSHELRTPLNPILGWTKLLRTRPFDSQATDRALETIERNAKLQAQLIEDLLDVSRILQGKVGLNTSPVNLVTTIEAALETVRLSAEAKSIDLRLRILGAATDESSNPPESRIVRLSAHAEVQNPKSKIQNLTFQVLGDANRLQQVMWNLLSNAVKFTPAGGQVEVRLEKNGGQAQIQVSDTGQGISPDFLPHVFEYFRQADATTTRRFGGLGLGLAIVHYLVELHGGTVNAESPGLGKGATFTVQLPLMGLDAASAPAVLTEQEIQNLSGFHILIVDDEADMRELIQFILEAQGATVSVAASAAEALHQIADKLPDIVISDIGMPEMDGYTLMRQIRAQLSEHGKVIPAIALTAYAGEINQQKAIAAGFQLHLAKPIEPEQLLQSITQVVAQLAKPSSE